MSIISCDTKGKIEEIVVIGGGLMGSSTAWQLSKSKQNVLLIEQQDYIEYDIKDFDPTNELGVPNRDYSSESQKHYHEFIDACLNNKKCSAPFSYSSKLTETILLGVIAGRFPGEKLNWDKDNGLFKEKKANQFLKQNYRSF